MDNIIKIEKTQFNRLRRKFNKFLKNIGNLESNNLNTNLIKEIKIVNSNIDTLINTLDLCNKNLIKKNQNISQDLKEQFEKDEEVEKIIQLFLPFMLLYQMNNNKL